MALEVATSTGSRPSLPAPPRSAMLRIGTWRIYAFLSRHLLVLPILLVGAWLRFSGLDQTSLWLDELMQTVIDRRPLAELLPEVRNLVGQAPLDYLIGNVFQRFGHSDTMVRLPAVLLGCGALVLLYWLGCRVFNQRVALLGTLLLAFAPLHLFYSREARPYALLTFMTLAVMLAFSYLWHAPSTRRTIVYGGIALLALYGHYYILIVLAVQGVLAALYGIRALLQRQAVSAEHDRRAFVGVALGIAGAVLGFLPWLLYDLIWGPATQLSGTGQFAWATLSAEVGDTLTAFSQFTPAAETVRTLFLACWLVGSIGALYTRQAPSLVIALLPPLGIATALALITRSNYFFAPRQLIFCLPCYLLGVAAGFDLLGQGIQRAVVRLWRGVRRPQAGPTVAGRWMLPIHLALLLPLLGGLWWGASNVLATNPQDWQRHNQEEGWRQAAALIHTYQQPGDRILVPAGCSNLGLGFNFNCIDLYYPDLAALIHVSPSLDDLKAQYAAAQGHAWILLAPGYNRTYFQGNDQLAAWISGLGLRLNNYNLVEVAYADSQLMIRPAVPLPAAEFQPLMGTAAAGGDVLTLTRPSPAQPVSMMSHALLVAPQRQYLVTFEYQAVSPSTGPFQVSVAALDSTIPGRFFAYNSPDVPNTWRSASLLYTSSADAATAASSRLIVRYDGSGQVAVRNIQLYDTTPSTAPVLPFTALPSGEFQPILGSAVADGAVLRLTRASADQPVSLTGHPLNTQPRKSYLITFEYRAPSPSTPPLSVYVDAPDSMTPGRHFVYSSPDLPSTWRSASFTYLPNSDTVIAAASRLIVRYDGSGSVEVRNIRISESP
ncbi:MAG: glycosyltransferase family 39 protein [Chloroflexota bacterium]|nr:glycosyltransferase family 39 protein [Chloroflexota bacterium]